MGDLFSLFRVCRIGNSLGLGIYLGTNIAETNGDKAIPFLEGPSPVCHAPPMLLAVLDQEIVPFAFRK